MLKILNLMFIAELPRAVPGLYEQNMVFITCLKQKIEETKSKAFQQE